MTKPLCLDEHRLFSAETSQRAIARELYAEVRDLPIVSPHGHTDPRWFAEDAPFENPTALLLAPKTGKQLRKDIRRKYEDAKETVDDWTEDTRDAVEDLIERGSEIADEIRERVAPLAKAIKK